MTEPPIRDAIEASDREWADEVLWQWRHVKRRIVVANIRGYRRLSERAAVELLDTTDLRSRWEQFPTLREG